MTAQSDTSTDRSCFNHKGPLQQCVSFKMSAESGRGVVFQYYHGHWDAIPDFDAFQPDHVGVCSAIKVQASIESQQNMLGSFQSNGSLEVLCQSSTHSWIFYVIIAIRVLWIEI